MADIGTVMRLAHLWGAHSSESAAVTVSMPAPLALAMWEAVELAAELVDSVGDEDGHVVALRAPVGVAGVAVRLPASELLQHLLLDLWKHDVGRSL